MIRILNVFYMLNVYNMVFMFVNKATKNSTDFPRIMHQKWYFKPTKFRNHLPKTNRMAKMINMSLLLSNFSQKRFFILQFIIRIKMQF